MRNGLHRRIMWGVTAAVLWAFVVSVSGSQEQASTASAPSGDAKKGAELYLADGCWQCHGYTGATGSAPPLVLNRMTESGFVQYLRNPRTTRMPLYSTKVLSDEEALDLYAYIKTFKPPLEAREIPLLQQIIDEH